MAIWVLTIVGLGVTAFASLLVDQHNTLQLSFPAHALVALVFAIAAGTGAWLYMREPVSDTRWGNAARLREQDFSQWLRKGAIGIGSFSGVAALSIWYLLTVFVPYLPATTETVAGVVERLDPDHSQGSVCNVRGVVVLQAGVRERFCYEWGTFQARRISPSPLTDQDRVSVVLAHTIAGSAILSMTASLNR